MVSLFPHLRGSRSLPVPLRRQLGVKQVSPTKPRRTTARKLRMSAHLCTSWCSLFQHSTISAWTNTSRLAMAMFVITHRHVHISSISIPQVTYQLSRYPRNVDIAQQSLLLVAVSVYDALVVSSVTMRDHWCHCSRRFFHCVYHRDPIELSIMTYSTGRAVRKYSCTCGVSVSLPSDSNHWNIVQMGNGARRPS